MDSPMSASNLSTGEQIKSLWKLGGLSLGELARRVYKAIDEDNITGRSSELAYNFILSIFPLLLFLISLFGLFAARGTALQSN